ncbi:unnamed protein product [Boreogadus saida]
MIDMRGEEVGLQPHCQARHEGMHSQYHRMKDDDDHWQDDLARWKTRRRSVSQDLMRKEEERKRMEQLMSGDGASAQRRKSIKTYREIVEDKERREEELRLAYRSARSPEEAAVVLQRYTQRFSISEAVMERLQLPKLLDHGPASPLSPLSPLGPAHDPEGPMRFLRQQSAPAPRFTATVEARVEEVPRGSSPSSPPHRPQIRSRSSEPPCSHAPLSPEAGPLLSPRPLPRAPASPSRPRGPSVEPGPSGSPGPSRSPGSPGPSAEPGLVSGKADILKLVTGDTGNDVALSTPTDSPSHLQPSPSRPLPLLPPSPTPATPPRATPTMATPTLPSPALAPPPAIQGPPQPGPGARSLAPPGRPSSAPTEQGELRGGGETADHLKREEPKFEAPPPEPQNTSMEPTQTPKPNTPPLVQSEPSVCLQPSGSLPDWSYASDGLPDVSVSLGYSSPSATRTDGKEQGRHCNEQYLREQERLRGEWERAQKEVVEEELKYHQEERKLLQETLPPLTSPLPSLASPLASLPSPRRGMHNPRPPQGVAAPSLSSWENQERQSVGSENYRTSDISTADDSMKTAKSSFSLNSSQSEAVHQAMQNGQKALPQAPPTTMAPARSPAHSEKQEEVLDCSTPSKPKGDRRSVSGRKLCSSCGRALGKGAAMIIETLGLFFHIQCFKCGVCRGLLGDTTTGTDVRIRNGLLNCHQCYIRSRSAGQPTTL